MFLSNFVGISQANSFLGGNLEPSRVPSALCHKNWLVSVQLCLTLYPSARGELGAGTRWVLLQV